MCLFPPPIAVAVACCELGAYYLLCSPSQSLSCQNEAVILQHIDQHEDFHPHIVEFRGLCKHKDDALQKTRLMIIMEYVT